MLTEVVQFGSEVDDIIARCTMKLCMTSRSPELLNHYLRHPRGVFSGWTLRAGNDVIGFAMTSVQTAESGRHGRIVECFIDRPDGHVWHAALAALTDALRRQSADFVLGYGSTPWAQQGYAAAGFSHVQDSSFQLRDRNKLLPRETVFHITPLEADYGYLV